MQSDLVKVYVGDDGPPREVERLRNIGRKAHGLVSWWGSSLFAMPSARGQGGNPAGGDAATSSSAAQKRPVQHLIVLDSDNACLAALDPNTGDQLELWVVRISPTQP